MNAIRIEDDDITIEELEAPDCEDCDNPATKVLKLDLRAIGTAVPLGAYCAACIGYRHSSAVQALAGAK